MIHLKKFERKTVCVPETSLVSLSLGVFLMWCSWAMGEVVI